MECGNFGQYKDQKEATTNGLQAPIIRSTLRCVESDHSCSMYGGMVLPTLRKRRECRVWSTAGWCENVLLFVVAVAFYGFD